MSGWLQGRSLDGGIDEIPVSGVPGRLWLCGKHLIGPDPEAALGRVEATAVVCLCQRHELENRYPDYVAWLQQEAGDRALWYPTPDLGTLPDTEMVPLVERSVALLRKGERLIVHCGAGIGRAGTLAVSTLLALGQPLGQAEALVAHRPMAGPEVGAQRELIERMAIRYRPGA